MGFVGLFTYDTSMETFGDGHMAGRWMLTKKLLESGNGKQRYPERSQQT